MKDTRKQAEPAWVRSNIGQGSIILAGPKGDVALDWKKQEGKGKNDDTARLRGVPPGTYRLRTTRIEREQDGVHWFISATAPPKKPLRFRSDKKVQLDVSDTIAFHGRVNRRGKWQLQLGFTLQDKDCRGLSIYKADRRVPVKYEVLSSKGKRLAWGKMNYG